MEYVFMQLVHAVEEVQETQVLGQRVHESAAFM